MQASFSSETATSPQCHCGHHLSFRYSSLSVEGETLSSVMCYCTRCDERALRNGETITARGDGRNAAEAYARRERALDNF